MFSEYLLALNAHPRIGSQTIKKALAPFSNNPEKLWKAERGVLSKKLEPKIATLILEAKERFSVEEELDKIKKLNIGYMTMYDKEYPLLLKEVFDHPAVLYIRGDVNVLKNSSLAVVGSRKFTSYGQKTSYDLSKKCAEAGLTVISGLALGIDAIAHKAALEAEGITVGVLGCGLDRIYPVSNFNLGEEILVKNGALISEFPPGMPPLKQNFPARNRIIAGLSVGTLVVEAAEQSGALITAFHALEYNREVFAVPGNIYSETSKGTNLLIQKGAKLVRDANDIFEELNIVAMRSIKKSQEILPENDQEKMIYDKLKKEETLINDLSRDLNLPISELNMALSLMEMKGLVKNIGGGYYKSIQ